MVKSKNNNAIDVTFSQLLKINLYLINIIVNTECQHNQNNAVGLCKKYVCLTLLPKHAHGITAYTNVLSLV